MKRHYEDNIHRLYPVLDLDELSRLIRAIAEYGSEWDVHTCLVLLLCAVASLSKSLAEHQQSPTSGSYFGFHVKSNPSYLSQAITNHDDAVRYWSMAKKRLGWVLDSCDKLISAQCFFLAGLWHLSNKAHHRARKMLTEAASTASRLCDASVLSFSEKQLAQLIHTICSDLHL